MKKGFTLVELLAVIIILGVIAIIFVPNTLKLLKQNNLKIYKIKESQMIKAAEDYIEFDENFIAPVLPNSSYITLAKLIEGNYLEGIVDTTSGNSCDGFVKVENNDTVGYDYDVCLVCDEYYTDNDFCGKGEGTNLATNGSFENGNDNWNFRSNIEISSDFVKYGSYSVKNNKSIRYQSAAKSATSSTFRIATDTLNHQYYFSSWLYTAIKGTGRCYAQIDLNYSGTYHYTTFKQTNANVWEQMSTVKSATVNPTYIGFNIVNYDGSDEAQECYGDGVMVLDLTAVFGVGNEPSKTWCDANVDYFDGERVFAFDSENLTEFFSNTV